MRLTTFSKFLITFFTICLLIAFFNDSSCSLGFTKKEEARDALISAGYHPIDVGGYDYFNCSEDDIYKTRFTAYSPDSSKIVKGCVCQGFFKGKTIRLD